MIVKLVEIYENKFDSFSSRDSNIKNYSLREVFINPEHVVLLRPNNVFGEKNSEITLPEGLHSAQKYTTIYINRGHSGMEILVVGEPSAIEEKLRVASKKVLKG